MTSLTDKMEKLRKSLYTRDMPSTAEKKAHNACLDQCQALAEAEVAVVGDWEESLQVEVLDDYLRLANSKYYIKEEDISGYMEEMRNHYKKLVAFIANLLAAKDREREKFNEDIDLC